MRYRVTKTPQIVRVTMKILIEIFMFNNKISIYKSLILLVFFMKTISINFH